MPQNSRLNRLKLWHDVDDLYVPIHHSRDLRDAINAWEPPTPVLLIEIPSDQNDCPTMPVQHCYNPELTDVFDFLAGFTLDSQPPPTLTIRTDESKPYYWLNIALTNGDHWSEVEAAYDLSNNSVTATISDSLSLILGFNIGPDPILDWRGIARSGIGLPETTYLVRGGGNERLEQYTSGYLTTSLTTTGQFTLTISPLELHLSAVPSMVLANPIATSTLHATLSDRLGHPAPDGTLVLFSTTAGAFPNELSTYNATSAAGQATAILSLGSGDDQAEISATVESITKSASVDVIHPSIALSVVPSQGALYSGQEVTYTYRFTNTGDIALTDIMVTDDNGTPGNGSDDHAVCGFPSLAPVGTQSCQRSTVVSQTITQTALVSALDPLGHDVNDIDFVTVQVLPVEDRTVFLPLILTTR
jgi:hypothetical protein